MKFYFPEGKRNLIGKKLRALREQQKISQKQLAAQLQLMGCDISELTVLRIEKDQRLVTDFELRSFCQYFHISPNEMLEFSWDFSGDL